MARSKFDQADHAFRTLLLELRRERGLSQAEVARRLGRPQSFVSKFETGERRLDFVETAEVCAALGLDVVAFATLFSKRVRIRVGSARRNA